MSRPDCQGDVVIDLTEFLLARYAEDEAAANHARWAMQDEWFTTAEDKVDEFVRRNSPAHVLAECEAKHEIAMRLRAMEVGVLTRGGLVVAISELRQVCQFLALPYADHPDFREEWRP